MTSNFVVIYSHPDSITYLSMFSREDYSYTLPNELIAQKATEPAHNARLIVVQKETWDVIHEGTFWELDRLIPKDWVIFFNNSKVLPARIPLKNITIKTLSWNESILQEGEIFFLRHREKNHFEALVRPGNKFKVGNTLSLWKYTFTVKEMTDVGRVLEISWWNIDSCMAEFGRLPLPPYVEYQKSKESDYQTVFAEKEGSVAAPTASLHFTQELLSKIKNPKRYITLHVGLWTFRSLDTDDIRDYAIHEEEVEIPLTLFREIFLIKTHQKKIIAVWTTVCRTLESLPFFWRVLTEEDKRSFDEEEKSFWDVLTKNLPIKDFIHDIHREAWWETYRFSTSIYITPEHHFLVVDDLITNFHLPESSLLVLVSAFLGKQHTQNIYKYAVEKQYRFYSFGDGMYIRGK